MVARAQTHPDALHARQGGRASGRSQNGSFPELKHLEPPRVIDLHQEDAVLHIHQARMSCQSLADNPLPFSEQRLVRISRKPASFPEKVFQQLAYFLHGRKSPFATVRTSVSGVLNDCQLSSGRNVKKACS